MTLTFGSLFAGIGGLDLGLERAGMTCAWQVEIDEYCQKVLTKHWPDVAKYRDVRSVGVHNLPSVDLVCGGFPCQDISKAGTRSGLAGSRSGLWFEYRRIISEIRPRYALMENVSALLGRGIDTILGNLAEIGYDAEWQTLSAATFGAPHLRERVFIVAYPASIGLDFGIFQSTRANQARIKETQQRYTHSWGTPRRGTSDRVLIVPDTGDNRKPTRVPATMDRIRGLGNAVVPQAAEFIGRCIAEHGNDI